MIPMNNPVMQLLMVMRSGGNPMAIMEQMAAQNPQVNMAVQMMRGKSPQQLEQLARNMAKERGVNLEDMVRQFGGRPTN